MTRIKFQFTKDQCNSLNLAIDSYIKFMNDQMTEQNILPGSVTHTILQESLVELRMLNDHIKAETERAAREGSE